MSAWSERAISGCAILVGLLYVGFWGAVIYVAIHLVRKFW